MSKPKKLTLPRQVQRLARPYNLPECLVSPKGAKLLPLYLRIEELSLQRGHCYAGDQSLADYLGLNKSTVVRQRLQLEQMGCLVRLGKADQRQLWPWWQWAAQAAKNGNLKAVEKLLHKVVQRSYQEALVFEEDEPLAPATMIVPSDSAILEYIGQHYPTASYFELEEQQQQQWSLKWRLNHYGDLIWLFEATPTPNSYDNYRRLQPGEKAKLEKHAPQYAWCNRDGARYIGELDNYLNPWRPGWAKRLVDRATARKRKEAGQATGKTGLNAGQAQWVGKQMSTPGGSGEFFK